MEIAQKPKPMSQQASPAIQPNRWSAYSTDVEIFIVLRDLDYYFTNENIRGLKKDVALKVCCYWKPPGALQWVQKCVTETVYHQNCPFVTKMNFHCERGDAPVIALKFEVCNTYLNIMSILGVAETSLSAILDARSRGIVIPVPFILNAVSGLCNQFQSGELYLRGEILRPCDYSLLAQCGLRRMKVTNNRPFHFEISKLNEDSKFEIPYPYTVIYRSQDITYDDSNMGYWRLSATPIDRVCNDNMDRVLKFEFFERFRSEPYGFVLTTIRKILVEQIHEYPITQNKDGKPSKKFSFKLLRCSQLVQNPLNYYFKKGMKMRALYAVDFSMSNWNIRVHKNSLHEQVNGATPYEEALQMVGTTIGDITEGDAVFYSFGNAKMEPYVSTFAHASTFKKLTENYNQSLCIAKMSAFNLTEEELSSACAPRCTNSKLLGSQLAPFLKDIQALLSVRRLDHLEYYLCFICTDGVISDMEATMSVLISLAKLPVSLVFIGIGMGDFNQLLLLEKEWTHPQTGEYPCRKLISVIHYRSHLKWDSSIRFSDHFKTNPIDLFRKELLSNVEEQALRFIRMFWSQV